MLIPVLALLCPAALSLVALLCYIFTRFSRWPGKSPASALVVIAHPDDETMFFVPSIRALIEHGTSVHILCLSTGQQAAGLLPRSQELKAAANVLGISSVEVVDSESMKDGMRTEWPADAVESAVASYTARRPVEIIISFDRGGISGHLNHKCTFAGIVRFSSRCGSPPCYSLETVPLQRKFSSALDALTSWALHVLAGRESRGALPQHVFIAYTGLALVHNAMRIGHTSQYVWFRVLYVVFSRYAFVNTLTRIGS